MNKIVKAEILWSRKCNLSCGYCAMADGRSNTLSVNEWIVGLKQLKQLGCEFAAFYGAEPLLEFTKLPGVVGYAEAIGINTTIITSGTVPGFLNKLKILHEFGAKSLTMSYDILPLDHSSETKSARALEGLTYFQKLGKVRDVAAVVTLTRDNYKRLPHAIEQLTERGIWTFFDFIHPDRHQPGSKVRSNGWTDDLLFTDEDYPHLREVLNKVLEMKDQGFLCHTSAPFINLVSFDDFDVLRNYSWNCAKSKHFPSWLTIDCDGSVYPCDDFHITNAFKVTNIANEFEDFTTTTQYDVLSRCPGCCWNTHLDAHLVKSGVLSIGDYVHGLEVKK